MNKFILLFLSLTILCSSACVSLKPGASSGGKKLYETFYVGEEGTQYFIKPLRFSSAGEDYLDLDITFRYRDEVLDTATLNVSIYSTELFKEIDALTIQQNQFSATDEAVQLMFVERDKGLNNCRYTAKLPLTELSELFTQSDWEINIQKTGTPLVLEAPNKTQKKIGLLNYEIFKLF